MKILMVDLARTVNGRVKHKILWLPAYKPGLVRKAKVLIETKVWTIDAVLTEQELVDEFELMKKKVTKT